MDYYGLVVEVLVGPGVLLPVGVLEVVAVLVFVIVGVGDGVDVISRLLVGVVVGVLVIVDDKLCVVV